LVCDGEKKLTVALGTFDIDPACGVKSYQENKATAVKYIQATVDIAKLIVVI
jgi:hypothetical protein